MDQPYESPIKAFGCAFWAFELHAESSDDGAGFELTVCQSSIRVSEDLAHHRWKLRAQTFMP